MPYPDRASSRLARLVAAFQVEAVGAELPDTVVYVERMGALLADATLHRVRIANPFVLRSVVPGLAEIIE